MTQPRELLATGLTEAATAADVDVNVYAQPPASGSLAVPALVIRPDNPWRTAADRQQPFGRVTERYVVVAVVPSSGDAVDSLRELVRLVDSIGLEGWRWTETGGIMQASEGAIDYLAATVRLAYSNRED